jgi:hypothetical protein
MAQIFASWYDSVLYRKEMFSAQTILKMIMKREEGNILEWKNAVYWDVAACGSCFDKPYVSVFKVKMEETLSAETSVLTRATRRHISKDGIRC